MRMTVAIKDSIESSIMRDLPPGPEKDKDKIIKLVQDDAIMRLPELVRKVWEHEALREFITLQTVWSVRGNLSISVPASRVTLRSEILSKPVQDALDAAGDAQVAHLEYRRELRNTIRRHVDSCSTVNVFCTRFPELAKYAPKEATAAKNLPATTELVDNLKAAGLKLGDKN